MKKISARIQPSVLTHGLSRPPKVAPATEAPDPTETLCKILSSTPASAIDTALDHSGVRPTPEVVQDVLSRFRNAGLLAYRFYRWSSRGVGAHTVRAHHAVIESLAKIRQFELVWEVVGSMKSEGVLNVETFCVIMRKYARAKKVDEALYCFNSMEKHGVAQNQAALDGLLSALCKSGNVRKAQEVFDSLRDRFDPGPKSYSILMEGWGREPNLPRAREVFREMVDRGVEPDAVTFGIMVDLLCKAGRSDEAVGIIEAMTSPSSYVYTVLIHAHGREGRVEEAEAVFRGMERGGVAPDAAAYNALAGAYVRGGMTDAVYGAVREMARRGIGPNARTVNVVIGGLIGRGECEEAAAAFRKMSRRCDPDADTYTMMIKMLCGKGEVEGAVGMWRYMKRRGFVPSMHTFSVLIDGLCREGDAERACVLAEEMIENGLRPVGVTFRRLSQLLVKQGRDDALQFLRQKMDLLVKEPLLD